MQKVAQDQEVAVPDFTNKTEPIIIHPLDPMAGKQEIEYDSKGLYRSFFSVLADPIRLEILKKLAFGNQHINTLQDTLNVPKITLMGHIKALVEKHYIEHVTDGDFSLTDGGRVITRLLNKVAKYLDPSIYVLEDEEIIFPFQYNFR